jgi:hypothetical protein
MLEQTINPGLSSRLQGPGIAPQATGAASRHANQARATRGEEELMEPRIAKLEIVGDECRKDIRSVDVRLAKIETLAEGLARHAATKADVAQLEATLLKWFLGTAIAIAGLAFAAAKIIH